MNDDDEDNNIFQLVSNNEQPATPQHNYRIVDKSSTVHETFGFLIFTPQHVAVMRDTGDGALPILILPLESVQYAKIIEDPDEQPELFN